MIAEAAMPKLILVVAAIVALFAVTAMASSSMSGRFIPFPEEVEIIRKRVLALYVKVMRLWGRRSTKCSNMQFKHIELVMSIEEQEIIRAVQRMLLVDVSPLLDVESFGFLQRKIVSKNSSCPCYACGYFNVYEYNILN